MIKSPFDRLRVTSKEGKIPFTYRLSFPHITKSSVWGEPCPCSAPGWISRNLSGRSCWWTPEVAIVPWRFFTSFFHRSGGAVLQIKTIEGRDLPSVEAFGKRGAKCCCSPMPIFRRPSRSFPSSFIIAYDASKQSGALPQLLRAARIALLCLLPSFSRPRYLLIFSRLNPFAMNAPGTRFVRSQAMLNPRLPV